MQEARFPSEAAVTAVDPCPTDKQQCVASFTTGPPALLQFEDESKRLLPCILPGAAPHAQAGSTMQS